MKHFFVTIALFLSYFVMFSQEVSDENVSFSQNYINEHQGKISVEIPQVSELVNILLVLHKDSEKDRNMFETKTEYYQKIKTYFAPYLNHPAIQTIHKYLGEPIFREDAGIYLFPTQAYSYYYSLKMNACAYAFDENQNIVNQGFAKQIGRSWQNGKDPMDDLALFEDFAKVSNFQKFYNDNKPYYDHLLKTFHENNNVIEMKKWLEEKFSTKFNSYRIFFSPLNRGGQSTVSFYDNGFSQTFMFISRPIEYPEHSKILNELLSSWIIFTEIDHNYVNPMSDIFIKIINNSFSNREKWAKGLGTEAYPDPYAVFNEYMTFALFTLYANDHFSDDNIQKFLPMYENMMENTRGFYRFKDFNRELLDKYRKDTSIKMPYLYVHMLKWANEIDKE